MKSRKEEIVSYLGQDPFGRHRPNEGLRVTRCRIPAYICGSFESDAAFFKTSEESELWWGGQRQTVKVKEENFVCSFFALSILTTLISLSLCRSLPDTFSLYCFTTERLPGDDSASWFPLNDLSLASQLMTKASHELYPVYLYLCAMLFLLDPLPLFDLQ